jgi:hypothetical protein
MNGPMSALYYILLVLVGVSVATLAVGALGAVLFLALGIRILRPRLSSLSCLAGRARRYTRAGRNSTGKV